MEQDDQITLSKNVTQSDARQLLQTKQGANTWVNICNFIKDNFDYYTINQLQFILPHKLSHIRAILRHHNIYYETNNH